MKSCGARLRETLTPGAIIPFIGVYDVFSAALAGRHFNGLFISGFSFAASHYGLPDIGFIAWPDIVGITGRIRTLLPNHHLLVDIDDGYGDPEVAGHVTRLLEAGGASGIILEDQLRPRRCGHLDGKQLMPLDDFLSKLNRVLAARRDLFVVARTDAVDLDDILERVRAFERAGADAVLVDGLRDLGLLRDLRKRLRTPLVFNQIAGGKSPSCSLTELRDIGVSLVNYSTPCLFAAQTAITQAMEQLRRDDGRLPADASGSVNLHQCVELLNANLDAIR